MKIERNGITFDGVKDVNGKLVCEKCGEVKLRMKMHLDGKDFFTNIYECVCGNTISKVEKRSPEDMAYWED